ncbi:RNA-binding (RRM/RBD/RNP motifs) family protein [Artemisia annua]|uniref:RNA-binding (RRM/RBD/RNP motifs) family protein n=1 Tax=Artemisia annua TaxID=35608 RepID=A0A2U1PTT0_ARTAN|nr:RNA-binding (RRM/RBD/RNP motifs) family protein [Artemisia annua]
MSKGFVARSANRVATQPKHSQNDKSKICTLDCCPGSPDVNVTAMPSAALDQLQKKRSAADTCPFVTGAMVVPDRNTGRSKGYGFVKIADEMERNHAINEMNGMYCSTSFSNAICCTKGYTLLLTAMEARTWK